MQNTLMEKADIIVKSVLEEKFKLEKMGKNPRLILISEGFYEIIHEAWVGSMKELPWGDSIEYNLQNRKRTDDLFLGDGSLLGLWLVKVETIDGFRVY